MKGFFGFIDVKLSEVGLCSRRLLRRGRCLSPLALCVCRAESVCTTGRGRCLVLRKSQQVTVPYAVE